MSPGFSSYWDHRDALYDQADVFDYDDQTDEQIARRDAEADEAEVDEEKGEPGDE